MQYENKFGPRKKSGMADVFHSIYILGGRRTGRERLARELGMNTGSVRSLVQFLKRLKLAKTSKSGMALTAKGRKTFGAISQKVLGVAKIRGHLTSKKHGYCIHIKNRVDKRKILQLRDIGIQRGAGGITFLIAKRNKFIMPYLNPKDYAKDMHALGRRFKAAGTVITAFGGECHKRAAWHLAIQLTGLGKTIG